MVTPADVLSRLLADDPSAPRVTFYEDTPGPTSGERIELSGRVLANWVNKAANALQEEWDAAPGTVVRLALPPHWRSLYWALAVWSVGGCVSLAEGNDAAAVVVTDDPTVAGTAAESGAHACLVTLPALARSASQPAPPGVMDEARELATYADQFTPWDAPADDDPALVAGGERTAYAAVVPSAPWPAGARLHTRDPELAAVLRTSLGAWAAGGSVVLSRGPADATRDAARLATEGVTVQA
jgi:uncharacterized protein (TIGR03089 family)